MAKTATQAQPIENLSFETAMGELEAIVRKLESGTADLESTIADYARGVALKNHCEARLSEARMKVDAIVNSGETPSLVPFDVKE